jgi:hypothetical protein
MGLRNRKIGVLRRQEPKPQRARESSSMAIIITRTTILNPALVKVEELIACFCVIQGEVHPNGKRIFE